MKAAGVRKLSPRGDSFTGVDETSTNVDKTSTTVDKLARAVFALACLNLAAELAAIVFAWVRLR